MSRRNKTSNSKDYIYDAILQMFLLNKQQIFGYKELLSIFDGVVKKRDKTLFDEAIATMIERGLIEKLEASKFRYNHNKLETVQGVVVTITSVFAFVRISGEQDDVLVPKENLGQVLVGDKVAMHIFPSRKKAGRIEGVITALVERPVKRYVGVVQISRLYAFVSVDSRQMPYDIFIPVDAIAGAKEGQKVICEIVSWAEGSKNPTGKIVEILGDEGDNDTEMHAILAEYDLPYHFTDGVENAADKISNVISDKEIASRRDFRDVTTFTIDPADAKDFDDALSVRKVGDLWEVGIHIADVTHYVTEGSVLDKEAVERATSVYLVDRVVPMLPEKLSNDLCSLRPKEQKLCFSAVFTLDEEANIHSEWFGRTVIYSDMRFSYEQAQQIIETGAGELSEEVLTLNRLAQKLRSDRYKHGSIAFERDEVKFQIDEKGKPLGVYFKVQKDSNHLIEEFMLLANRKVAEFIAKKKSGKSKAPTFVYRIHDKPNSEKFTDFCGFIAKFGFNIKAKTDRAIAREINKLLGAVKGKSVENLFSTLAIRTMAKAIYSTENIGHYGLAFDYYTHFTSPIRRYPDMMVHRLLQTYLDGGKSVSEEACEELCEHSSAREIRAAEAERASIKYKMVEYMTERIGQEFIGTISGVTEWGIYVELNDTKIEGMVSVRDMKDDYYEFDNKNYRIIGQRKREVLTLGDTVKVTVIRADLKRKQLDYELISRIDFETGQEHLMNSEVKKRRKDKK